MDLLLVLIILLLLFGGGGGLYWGFGVGWGIGPIGLLVLEESAPSGSSFSSSSWSGCCPGTAAAGVRVFRS